ncbi:MAG: FGGY-family carbohydrate kinase [Hyphomicrobiales bacterium]
MDTLYLGIDVGTSGVRTAVVDAAGKVVASARAKHPEPASKLDPGQADANDWWHAVAACLDRQIDTLREQGISAAQINAASVDGTSGTMVLVNEAIQPVTPGLMYSSSGFDEEAATIAQIAPEGSITRGSNSALARLLRLQSYDKAREAKWLCHQADFILANLAGHAGFSDDNNALKTGFDPATGHWPEWFNKARVRTSLLPEVKHVGVPIGRISAAMGARFGFSPNMHLLSGTTDSIAAFLATGANRVGDAVTSLGTTLAIKLLCDVRIDDPAQGVYSHRLGDQWLVGGASNTGGGVLAHHFSPEQMTKLSATIDPDLTTGLDYYPLLKPGERFPINDPNFPARLTPRPNDDALFLHGMLESIARIEKQGYDALNRLGGPPIGRLFTAGGGAQNPAWTAIRKRIVCPQMEDAANSEASVGTAFLCRRWADLHS